MKDSWIDKNEIDELISGFSKEKPEQGNQPVPQPGIMEDVPSTPPPLSPVASPVPKPQDPLVYQSAPIQNHSVPLQRMVVKPEPTAPAPIVTPAVSQPTVIAPNRGPNFVSPFSIDEDDEEDGLEDIDKVAMEAAEALRALQDVRIRAERGGLLKTKKDREKSDPGEEISTEPLDRIPLDVEIDPDLSLKNRLAELAAVLAEHVEMEEMTVVDHDGFALFETRETSLVKQNVVRFVDSIRKVYGSETDARQYSASQLAMDDEKWLCIIPTDGDLEGRFVLKALLGKPLDRPEVYVVVELLNEVLRPEMNTETSP